MSAKVLVCGDLSRADREPETASERELSHDELFMLAQAAELASLREQLQAAASGAQPGDCHSCCNHPDSGCKEGGILAMFAMLASVGRTDPVVGSGCKKLGIKADDYGVRSGWFNWPWNFDPVWLRACNGWTEKVAVTP